MKTKAFEDITLICCLHTADLYGSARSMLAHIEAVGQEFRDVIVLLSAQGPLCDRLQRRGVIVRVVPFVHRGLRKRMPWVLLGRDFREVVASRLQYVRALKTSAYSQKCIIHVHSSVCLHAMYAAVRARVPLVVHVRETRKPTVESWLREQCVRRWADRIITVSDGIKRGYSNFFQQKAITIYNWVSVPERMVEKPGDRNVIGFVGSVYFEKGIREFLEMCARLKEQGEAFEAHIYGQPLNEDVERWCLSYQASHGLSHRIRWFGVREIADEIYANIDLLVHPTYYDALPRSVMEAMAWGVPVVASQVGGIPEMLGDEAGCLVPPRDISLLTSAVTNLLRNADIRKQMGAAARQRAQRLFSADRYRREMLQVYDEILANRRYRNG